MERTWKARRIISHRDLIEETMGKKTSWSILKGGGDRQFSRVRNVSNAEVPPVVIGRKLHPPRPFGGFVRTSST
jgi:hypothetical protein